FFRGIGRKKLVPDEAFQFEGGAVDGVVCRQVPTRQSRIVAGDRLEAGVFVLEKRVCVDIAVEEVDVSIKDAQSWTPGVSPRIVRHREIAASRMGLDPARARPNTLLYKATDCAKLRGPPFGKPRSWS